VPRDYYEVLGLERSATLPQIKSAYRKLAVRHHPDRNPGDAAAEEKFKEAAEAYAVLSDTEKRSRYDRFGHQATPSGGGFDPGTFVDFSDILGDVFGDIFGGRAGGRRRRAGASRRRGGVPLRSGADPPRRRRDEKRPPEERGEALPRRLPQGASAYEGGDGGGRAVLERTIVNMPKRRIFASYSWRNRETTSFFRLVRASETRRKREKTEKANGKTTGSGRDSGVPTDDANFELKTT